MPETLLQGVPSFGVITLLGLDSQATLPLAEVY